MKMRWPEKLGNAFVSQIFGIVKFAKQKIDNK